MKIDWLTLVFFTALGSIGGYFMSGLLFSILCGAIAIGSTLGWTNLVERLSKERASKTQ